MPEAGLSQSGSAILPGTTGTDEMVVFFKNYHTGWRTGI